MISYEDFKKIINDIKDDKIMIWPLRITVTVLSIFLITEVIWYNIDRHKGKHVKMLYGFFEDNLPDTIIKPVTVIKYKDSIAYKTKIDTVYKPIYKTIYSTPPIKNNNTHIDKADKVDIH